MTIPADAKPTPIPKFEISAPLVEKTGELSTRGVQRMEQLRGYVSGMGRIIPCSCSSLSNVLTLTPNGHGDEDGDAPRIEGYVFGDIYLFVADANSTGSVTATVVPKTGTLATLKVYINGGASQAGAADVTSGHVYLGVYAYNLDANAGGIVIRHP